MTHSTSVEVSVADRSSIAKKKLSQVYEAIREQKATPVDFEELHTILQALPLKTTEMASVKCRMGNAERYFEMGEKGAAAFELLLVLRGLEGSL